MKRRSRELILIFSAVLITFAIVFFLMRGPAFVNQDRVRTEAVSTPQNVVQIQTGDQQPEQIVIEGGKTGVPADNDASQSAIQNQAGNQPSGQQAEPGATALTSSDITGATHFVDCAFRTDGNAIIGIPGDVIQSGGINLEPGDEIAVLTPDGGVCAGAAVWTGENTALTAWSDTADTGPIEGMQEGDTLRFRIWDQSAGEEIEVSNVTYLQGDGQFIIDGIYVVGSLSGG